MKHKKRKNYITPDDYYSNGFFELARFGRNISMRNTMTPEEHKEFLALTANKYDGAEKEIDKIVSIIRQKVSACDPLELMNFATSMRMFAMLNKTSESQYSVAEDMALKSVEYIQSVLISTECNYVDNGVDQNSIYHEILFYTEELYKKVMEFVLIWGAKASVDQQMEDKETLDYIVQAQLSYWRRGRRYQVFQIPFFAAMLNPYDAFFQEIYSTSAAEVIEGLTKLERSLSSGRLDSFKKLGSIYDQFRKLETEEECDQFMEQNHEENSRLMREAMGTDLFYVKKVTGWPDSFINDLAFEIGENKELFGKKQFSGWPIWNLPVERKPFLKIDGAAYCFDYYTLFDYIYRAIQHAIRGKGSQYSDSVGKIQQHTSEELVEQLFQKLLPGCKSYRGNFYLKDYENDILIMYKDVLLIVEVKAGTFTYTPAMMDFESHKKSFEALVNKAGEQCRRTEDYIRNNSPASFGDNKGNKKVDINLSDYTQVYSLCVTIDEFSTFAAHAEKVAFVYLQSGTISISVNDLWVYSEYFTSPIRFIHFLKQRQTATMIKELSLIDELDHLGLYISNNMYSLHAKELGKGHAVQYLGYCEELDKYFASLYSPQVQCEKPDQQLPKLYMEIADICHSHQTLSGETRFTNFLFDFSTESKGYFSQSIYDMLSREKELGEEIVGINVKEGCYCLFVSKPGIRPLTAEYKESYAQGLMLYHDVEECYLIEIVFDEYENLQDVKHKLLTKEDIPADKISELYQVGVRGAENRKTTFLIRNNQKKIYPNDLCPCGSGKKYKKCCGGKRCKNVF